MKKSLYDGRVEDLEENDVLAVACERCGHHGVVSREAILAKLGQQNDRGRPALQPYDFVRSLKLHLRCSRCPVPLNSKPHHDLLVRVITKEELARSALWKNWDKSQG